MLKEVKDYLVSMVSEFNDGNDNYYGKGKVVEFKFEEIEKGDVDFYDEEDVELFLEVRDYLRYKGEVSLMLGDIEYKFKVSENDIVCSFIEGEE